MVYMPNQLQTPMLREAGDFQATLGNSNVTAAVAVAPNALLHVGGHYQALDFSGLLNAPSGRSHQWLAEGGVGMFGDLGYKDFRWTVLAGGGTGGTWSTIDSDRFREGRFLRGYLQPNIGYVTPIFEIVASARLTGVKFNAFSSTGTGPDSDVTPAEMTSNLWMYVEPSLTVKVGYRWIKVFAQPVLSFPLNRPEEEVHLPLNLVVGLSIDLAQWHGDWSF